MTILFLARLFYPHIGGVEKHVMEISKRLVAKGHKVIVITEHPGTVIARSEATKQSLEITELVSSINVYRIHVGKGDWFKKFRIWKSIWKIRKVIKGADIIHCHDVFFWYMPFRFIFPLKRVYTTFHGYESYPITKKAITIHKISEKLSFGNICIGDFIKKWYGTNPTFVSYGAVKIPNTKYQIPNTISALFFGRLDDQTGILTYNEAFKKLRKKYPEFKFLIIGEGPCKNLIDKRAKAVGFQKDPEKYFQNYHFAFVSGYLSILEAMASKRLVFSVYDNPLKMDYLKMAPFKDWIIITSSEDLLIKKIDYYLSHPEEEEVMIEKAYQWVKHQSWEKLTRIYLNLWKKAGI